MRRIGIGAIVTRMYFGETAMIRPARQLVAACIAIAASGVLTAAAGGEGTRVVAQDLVALRASQSVSAAIWTRRPDSSYTLQLVLWRGAFFEQGTANANPAVMRSSGFTGSPIANLNPTANLTSNPIANLSNIDPRAPAQQRKKLEITVWLLRADGTMIFPTSPSTNPSPDKCTGRCMTVDVQYRFPVADAVQAVAAAVRIGDEYYIEKLQSLEPAAVN
jgi:hypothetical protein